MEPGPDGPSSEPEHTDTRDEASRAGDTHTAPDAATDAATAGERPTSRPQSPASKGIRAGLFVALAAALLALAANDSWLLPSLDADGVVWLHAASSLAAGEGPRLPVAAWSASDSLGGLDGRSPVVPRAMAPLVRGGTRNHVAALWFLAGSLALLTLTVAWVAGGAAGVEGGLLAGAFLLFSPLAVEATTALRPEALAAALVSLQLGLMAYRPRSHLAHGAAAALVWVVHPAGAGAVAAAVLWPFLPDTPPLGPRLPAPARRASGRAVQAGLALLPAVALLLLGPVVAGLPSLPPVLGGGLSAEPLTQVVRWAGAGLPGIAGVALGILALAGGATLVLVEAVTTPPVEADIPWYHARTPDLVANRARAAGWLVVLGVTLGALVAGGGGGLERSGLLVAAPVATVVALAVTRWVVRAPERQGWLLTGVVGVWLALSGWSALERSREIRTESRGLTHAAFLESEMVRWLDNRLPPGLEIYASNPHLVLIQTTRAARTIPREDSSVQDFARRFAQRPGVVVLTGADTTRAQRLGEALGIAPVVQGPEGWILAPVMPPGD